MADMAKVKEVRARTGVGFGDCKKALDEAGDDIDKAIEIIRKQSAVKAAKKADRTAAEGLLALKVADDAKSAAIVEINVETDFAARNERFVEFCGTVADRVLAEGEGVLESLEDARNELVQTIGENITLRRATKFETADGTIGCYLHANDRVGAIVELTGGDAELGKDVAMHVTAMSPLVVSSDQMPEDVVSQEREIYVAQAAESGKPDDIVQKMVDGRLRKFLAESSLVDQPFVREPDTKVGKMLSAVDASCVRFVRFEVGEGIDKNDEDFAEEVKRQLQ